jgi:hypothetical protein
MRIHKHTPYKRIEVIHIVDKRLHIFLIHMTSHPHCLILIHIHNMKPELIRRLTHLTGATDCLSYVHYHLECHRRVLGQMISPTHPPIHQVLP